MYSFEKSIVINRSPQEVFDYTSNPANLSQWQSDVESSKWTSDSPHGVGSTFVIVRRFLGRRSVNVEITGWNPPKLRRTKGGGGPIQVQVTESYEPQGDATVYTVAVQMETRGPFKLLEGFVGRQAEKQSGSQPLVLKRILEAGKV